MAKKKEKKAGKRMKKSEMSERLISLFHTISSGRLVKNRYWCCGFSVILANICSRHSGFQWEKSLMPVSRKFCGRFFSISRSLLGKNSGFSKSSIM